MSIPPPSPPPFGLILPSRPVVTNPVIISPTQYAFTFPSAPAFSHIIVFLLPGTALPNGTLAGVYVQLPSSAIEFRLLGALGPDKQSAIFRINGNGAAFNGTNGSHDVVEDEMTDVDATSTTIDSPYTTGDITVGISIEPAVTVSAQLDILRASQPPLSTTALVSTRSQQQWPSPLSTKVLAQRIIKNAFNFLASFAGTTGVGGQEVVPLKSFQDWWSKFERRIENDPGFLEREAEQ
ncbi:hypothetical protein MMC28_003451 [Mycoblastus sanguinarius]|nr:hypothetical protein [Mycoblastus sanguinarius]